MRRRVEMEDEPVPRVVDLEALGDESVKRERLVVRPGHQRLIDVADQALGGRQRLDIVGVQAVERAEIGEIEPAAFGRVGVDVWEMGEVRRQRRLAMHGDRADRFADFGARRRGGDQQSGGERQTNRKTCHT